MHDSLDSARQIIAVAKSLYAGSASTVHELETLEKRLDEPLRVALVGSVKAGKSTLLNGLLGERIAPTDSRECTRIVTWYHHGTTPAVRGQLTDGASVVLPARRQVDRLELDLQGLPAEDFARIDVTWPAPGIRDITLIDTPGTVSISQQVSHQTNEFLAPDEGAAGADAVVYLLRSLHESDVSYLKSLQERTQHGSAMMGTIAVLSRADEVGAGRLDSMVSVNQVVDRLRHHPDLRGVCETIVPVAGLLGMGATTLRQADFAVFRNLASRSRTDTQRLLASAEHFIGSKDEWLPSEHTRIDLVDRFGMYGIRLAFAVIRGGVDDAGELADELLRRSGLGELRRVIDVHFTQRQSELKAHSIVLAVHRLLRKHPTQGGANLLVRADEHLSRAHTFIEMQLVGRIAAGTLGLSSESVGELERLIGGRGADDATRLGMLDQRVDAQQLVIAATEHLRRWRKFAENPLLDSDTHHACKVAERSCETIIARLTSHHMPEV